MDLFSMFNIRNFFLAIITSTLVLFLSIYTYYYQQTKQNSAQLILSSLQKDTASLSYAISKRIHDKAELSDFRSIIDRTQATNNFIEAILLSDEQNILLKTKNNYANIPNPKEYYIPENMDSLTVLSTKKMLHQKVYYYNKSVHKYLNFYIVINQSEVNKYIHQDINKLVIYLVLLTFFFLTIQVYFTSKYLVKPLEKLRQYSYYNNVVPAKFKIKELEYIRASLFQTFERLQHEKEELYKLSRTDMLSGLANREALNERLGFLLSLAKRDHTEFALLFLDLDHFKNVNDSLGHKVGDILLQELSAKIQHILRDNDIVARVGGDEFVIVLSQYASTIELTQVIDRIQDSIKNPFVIDNNLIEITSSIGIAFYPKDGVNEVELLRNADIAMYQAKKEGRNQYHFFTESLNIKLQEEILINSEMKEALRNNEFELYYQPKTDTKSGVIVSCEALIRWNHPTKGLIPPIRFIEIAERDGFIVKLGEWILKEAMQQQVRWKNQNICDIPISINVSIKQLANKSFESTFKKIVQDSGIETNKIDIEIVETLFLSNNQNTAHILDMFHDIGATISLDDFGTGYSSLSYLKDFRVDTLKIDKVFIDDFNTESGSIFLETIIKMGQTLQLKVLCEGVETQEQLQYLQDLDCELYQGYLCSKPLPADDFAQLYLNS